MENLDPNDQIHGGDLNGDAKNDGGEGEIVTGGLCIDMLPEDCISKIISFTGPREACVGASVSKALKSAAGSDAVWERFLPPDYPSLVPESRVCPSKKELYLSLSDDPVLIDDGKKSFWLEKHSGKICWMISAMDLSIIWGDTPAHWQWIPLPESRFEKVAELLNVCWLEIRGKIKTLMLSPRTQYSFYMVFKSSERFYGFRKVAVEAEVGIVGNKGSSRLICFDGRREERWERRIRPMMIRMNPTWFREEEEDRFVKPKERGDGWMEVELGEVFNNGSNEEEIEISVMETNNGLWKCGLIILGIEIRPT